jgi:hypothetical protein
MTKHGTSTRYQAGCRCEECTRAWRRYQSKRRKERWAYTQANGLPSDVRHSSTAYSNWGCRCAVCTEAWRIYYSDYQRRRRAAVT